MDKEKEKELSDFCADMFNASVWKAMGSLGGNSSPEPLENPKLQKLVDDYLAEEITSAYAIYLAGKEIFE